MNVKIGNRSYEVLFEAPVRDNELIDGSIDYSRSQIKVSENISTDYQRETLLHEVLHGVVDDAKLYEFFDEKILEKLITTVTPRLIQVLCDNAELVKFITNKSQT
jgi:hypothetical protein